MNKNIALLVLIVLLGTIVRFAGLDSESLWTDEMLSVDHARQTSLWQVVEHVGTKEAAPPGHYLLLHYWIQIFGSSDVSVRLPSVLFSIASILVMYALMKLFFSERASLIAALLFSISLQQVVYAQEARLYSMFTFIALLTTYFFIRGFVMDEKWLKYAYLAALTFALYTNYLAAVLIAFYGFLLVWNNRKIGSWMLMTGCSLLFAVPLLLLAFQQFMQANRGLSDILMNYGIPQPIAGLGLFIFALPSIIVCILLVSCVIFRKRITALKVHLHQLAFVILVALFCAASAYVSMYPLSLFGIPVFRVPLTNSYFLVRHSLFLVPLLYVYAAWKTDTLRRAYAIVVLVMILVTNVFALVVYYTTSTKPDWEGAMNAIVQHSNGTPFMLLDRGGGSNAMLLDRYYPDAQSVALTQYASRSEFYQIPDATVIEMVQQLPEFWLVLSKSQGTGNYYRELFDAHFERGFSRSFDGVDVYLYRAG